MTRSEELQRKQERNRREYEARREMKILKAKEYYDINKDYRRIKDAEYRHRRRREAKVTKTPPPSTDALEAQLPPALRMNIRTLRAEFLSIHISKRPPYDKFLRDKTIEHLKKKQP